MLNAEEKEDERLECLFGVERSGQNKIDIEPRYQS